MIDKEEWIKSEKHHFDYLASTKGEIWWGNRTEAGIQRKKRRAKIIKENLTHIKDPNVLELGCGIGNLTKWILEEMPFLKITCCDLSPKCIEIIKTRYEKYSNVRFEISNVTNMHYGEGSFDAVIGNSILHHVPLIQTLKECFRVLKTGGLILFFEPNMTNPQIIIEKNINFIKRLFGSSKYETAFFRKSLSRTVFNIGFSNVSIQPFDFLHPIIIKQLINLVSKVGFFLEKMPLIKEFSGSLIIRGTKFDKVFDKSI